jgi:hypothetical protein
MTRDWTPLAFVYLLRQRHLTRIARSGQLSTELAKPYDTRF